MTILSPVKAHHVYRCRGGRVVVAKRIVEDKVECSDGIYRNLDGTLGDPDKVRAPSLEFEENMEHITTFVINRNKDRNTTSSLSLKVGYRYSCLNGNVVTVVSSDEGVFHCSDNLYRLIDGRLINEDLSNSGFEIVTDGGIPDTFEVEEIDTSIIFPSGFPFTLKPTKSFLSTVDIQNIANYIDKIEQIVNRIGLNVEMRIGPPKKEDEK